MVAASVRDQFNVIGEAAKEVDLIVCAGALQSAGRSLAEGLKIPYVYAAYCAGTLPSWNHPPPQIRSQSWPRLINGLLWTRSERSWNSLFRSSLNEQRATLGLAPIESVPRHVFTQHPWLAADAVLGPAAARNDLPIFQTGAWLLQDSTPLPDALEQFLASGDPPIYFGFGSTLRPGLTVEPLLDAARKLGRRAIVMQGWANLDVPADRDHCIAIGEVNHEKLLPRVAAVVHHGGAGTTTAAARAGKPQIVIPQAYDQFYWAQRIKLLGAGVAIQKISTRIADQLASALRDCLNTPIASRAHELASRIELNGASIAAQSLSKELL
jgi:vancomycin aglycone glucosyltransferase